jgi:hypothetical protein
MNDALLMRNYFHAEMIDDDDDDQFFLYENHEF